MSASPFAPRRRLATLAIALSLIIGLVPGGSASAATGDPVLLNEVLGSTTGDDVEYIELYGTPGTSLAGLSLVIVESDAGTSNGSIDRQFDFGAGAAIGSNGFYLVGNSLVSGAYGVTPNASIALNFVENSSYTLGLVQTASLSGTTVSGSEIVLDAVALTDGEAAESFHFDAPVVGPDDSFLPAGARRVSDGEDTDSADDWVIADFTLGSENTPTAGTFDGGGGDSDVVVNEVLASHTGTDNNEYIELYGEPGLSLAGLSLLVVEGDAGASLGAIDRRIDFSTEALGGNGFFLVGNPTGLVANYGVTPNKTIGNDYLENSSMTVALVETASISGGSVTGDEVALDAVGITDGGAGDTFFFSAPTIGPDGTFFPAGARRVTDGVDTDTAADWVISDFDLGAANTPTAGTGLGNQPVQVDCGPAVTVLEGTQTTRQVTATDLDGLVTGISIAVTPASDAITLGPLDPATTPGGTASATITIGDEAGLGTYEVLVTATNDDAEPQSSSCTLSVTVSGILTVGEVQGPTLNTDNPLRHASPHVGQEVWVRGVITQRVRAATGPTSEIYGFFLQSAQDDTDGNADSSDGIFVWHDRFFTLLREGSGFYTPTVGDEVVLRGLVEEDFNLTRMRNPRLVSVERQGVAGEVPVTEAEPPDDLLEANLFWERHEGMRFHLDAGAHVVAARDVFASTFDGEVWVIRGDHPIANRADPYTRLVYRDTHPLDDIGPAGSWDNGNGMRIMLQSHGLKFAQRSNQAMIAPARTYDTVTNELYGGLFFAFSKYGIEIEQDLDLEHGVDPAENAPPVPDVSGEEFSSSTYNVENLYDYRDDPNDGCDFAGNDGCDGVDPPFDYVPASEDAYEAHLADLAAQIAGPMHAPDLLMIQEAEDQDICWIEVDALACGSEDDADGRPDAMQDLALAIAALGGPAYDSAFDRNGADDRGIISAFLFRTDTVELLPASADDPILGESPTVAYPGGLAYNADVQNPKAFNATLPDGLELGDPCDELPNGRCVYTRDPQVGHFRVWRDGIGTSVFTDVWAISNHFSSAPDRRVEQRIEQAAYNAALADAIVAADPGARLITGGDFNVFPRPDDPFAPGHPLHPSDQLAPMYDAGLLNLWDVLAEEVPASAYSYSFIGMVQTLDSQWANDGQFADLVQVRIAHVNADFAADYDGDGARGASDHDPQVARWNTDVTFDRLHSLVDYYVAAGQLDAGHAFLFHRRLDRAEAFFADGMREGAMAQLRAFGNQAYDYATPTAAGAMEKEGDRLASHL